MDESRTHTWRETLVSTILVLVISGIGCSAAFAVWLNDLYTPQLAILGSGNRLSILVVDGAARLLIATGDDPIAFENAMTRVRPLFARRIDVLLAAGSGDTLLVPLAAKSDPHVRTVSAMAPLPASPERDAFGAIVTEPGPRRITLGPSMSVTVETRYPFGVDPAEAFPAWRAIVERGATRVVVLSDGEAASLFPPVNPASVLVVSGDNPVSAWPLSPAPVLVTNAEAIDGPDLRSAFDQVRRPPEWGFRVFLGEALRLRFVANGIEIASESAQSLR